MFEYEITSKSSKCNARCGEFTTPHGKISTPVFMPVGTKATVKTASPDELKTLGSEIILANTYHLYMRPGHELIKRMGGLHKWMNWDKPILTDSGGFQVFSLAQEKRVNKGGKAAVKITEEGVEFKSHLDGSTHFFTPEKAIQIQHDLGADIIMAFDECAPALSDKSYTASAMTRTHNWLEKCIKEHEKLNKYQKLPRALFPIIQGGIHKDLRIESAKFVQTTSLPGIAIGGLSVGESREDMLEMIETVIPNLDGTQPVYLMGVGTPSDLIESIERGIDMFDCVHPTRMARHGAFWTNEGRFSIKKEQFKFDDSPLDANCQCYSCQNFSRSYLRHLIFEKEILGLRLMTIHNLHFLIDLTHQIREAISKDSFKKFKKNFYSKYKK
ncbi:tRNA guanosine(34) transglycosylase Tgt [Candidatus Peregrinibacteria bacterium]|nr:tRNA guanosine(34) transglycosylase Tgt [Candidatus Peregrinibacteria bacterium]